MAKETTLLAAELSKKFGTYYEEHIIGTYYRKIL